jgi:hypothetical protein
MCIGPRARDASSIRAEAALPAPRLPLRARRTGASALSPARDSPPRLRPAPNGPRGPLRPDPPLSLTDAPVVRLRLRLRTNPGLRAPATTFRSSHVYGLPTYSYRQTGLSKRLPRAKPPHTSDGVGRTAPTHPDEPTAGDGPPPQRAGTATGHAHSRATVSIGFVERCVTGLHDCTAGAGCRALSVSPHRPTAPVVCSSEHCTLQAEA